ncbi:MAG: TonB C-terminal domain-containing protein [Proteobacteria bacterium]|nr:TonB C-terminal domain-containing protein [Pseudomonadota bacterium]
MAQVGRYQANMVGVRPDDYAVARFTIARSGSLINVSVVSSSGNPSLDRGLLAAFHSVAPFPPMPADLGDSYTFTLAFGPRYRR